MKVNPVLRLLPSLTDVAFVLPLFLLFGRLDGARTMLGDGDTGWHVRTGEWILAHHEIPRQDLFSFTKPEAPWFAWEWLWDVIFAWLHSLGGMAAVVIVSILLICLTSGLFYRLVIRRCDNPLVAIVITFLVVGGSSVHWLARPHLFTMLFFVVWLIVIDRAERGNTRSLWLLPALTVPWTNLHGGFFVGIFLLLAFATGRFLNAGLAVDSKNRSRHAKMALIYLCVATACAVASLVNPYSYHLHQHIASYLADKPQLESVSEFQTLSFHSPPAIFFEVLLALAAPAAVKQARSGRIGEALLIGAWAHMALMASRNIPLFLLISGPSVAKVLDEFLRSARTQAKSNNTLLQRTLNVFGEISDEIALADRPWRVHVFSILAVLMLTVSVSMHQSAPKLRPEYDPSRYPAGAIAFFRSTASERHIFCDDEWGDYLAYRLYPSVRVFIDGRSDFYGAQFGQEYQDIIGVKYDWETKLDRYQVDTLLLPAGSALAGAVKESSRWTATYDDGMAILFERVVPTTRISAMRGKRRTAGLLPVGTTTSRESEETHNNKRQRSNT
jgi:hypothetical protein